MGVELNIRTLEVLSKVTESLGRDVKRSLRENDRYATGETEKQIEAEQTVDKSTLYGPPHIYDLEFGKEKGTLPAEERIRAWCIARGIDLTRVDDIRAKIYHRGYRGRSGVLTNPLSEANVSRTLDQELTGLADLTQEFIADALEFSLDERFEGELDKMFQ